MIRVVNPVPAGVKCVVVIPAPKIRSFAELVVALPLLAVVPLPAAPAAVSKGFDVSNPLYSRASISTKAAAWLNVTVTVLLPAAMFLA